MNLRVLSFSGLKHRNDYHDERALVARGAGGSGAPPPRERRALAAPYGFASKRPAVVRELMDGLEATSRPRGADDAPAPLSTGDVDAGAASTAHASASVVDPPTLRVFAPSPPLLRADVPAAEAAPSPDLTTNAGLGGGGRRAGVNPPAGIRARRPVAVHARA